MGRTDGMDESGPSPEMGETTGWDGMEWNGVCSLEVSEYIQQEATKNE